MPRAKHIRAAHWAVPEKESVPGRVRRGFVDRLHVVSAAVGGGLLLCVSFPPFGWWYAAIAAFALLAWALLRERTTVLGGFGYGLLFGLAFYIPLLPWTGELVGPIPWLALSVVSALFPAVFGVTAVIVRRLPGAPIWFAALWTAMEWVKCMIPFGGFPWGVVAYSQADSPLLAVVRFGGVPLLSFAVVLTGFSLGALAHELYRWWRRDPEERKEVAPRVVLPGACVCVVLIATAAVWPGVRQSAIATDDDPVVTVAAVQGNVPRLGLDFNAQRRAVLDYHVRETLTLAEDVRAGRVPQPQLVIWPENSSDIDPIRNPDAAAQISIAADAIQAPILVGAVLQHADSTAENPTSTNTVIVWNPRTGPDERHDKRVVQPFGEYLPMREVFRKLSPYADRAGYFVPVPGDGVVKAGGVTAGVTTCWEVIFDDLARDSVRNGAGLLVVPTNNALFGEGMSEQQLAFARVRAVEHDRYTVVAGTTGISAVIAPDGREMARTNFFEPAYLDMQIHVKTGLTPATRWGPIVLWVLAGIAVAALVAGIVHSIYLLRPRSESGAKPAGDQPPTYEPVAYRTVTTHRGAP